MRFIIRHVIGRLQCTLNERTQHLLICFLSSLHFVSSTVKIKTYFGSCKAIHYFGKVSVATELQCQPFTRDAHTRPVLWIGYSWFIEMREFTSDARSDHSFAISECRRCGKMKEATRSLGWRLTEQEINLIIRDNNDFTEQPHVTNNNKIIRESWLSSVTTKQLAASQQRSYSYAGLSAQRPGCKSLQEWGCLRISAPLLVWTALSS